MKNLFTPLAVSALLAAAAAAPAPADVQEQSQQLGALLTQARSQAREAGAAQAFENLRGHIFRIHAVAAPSGGPTEAGSRVDEADGLSLLDDAVADLAARAREAWVSENDFAMVRERVIAQRLDSLLVDLERTVREGGLSREYFDRKVAILTAWADQFSPATPDAAAYRERLRAAVADYAQRARGSMEADDVRRTREALLRMRTERALEALQRRAQAGQASRYDYLHAAYLILATAQMNANLANPRAVSAIQERLQQALAGLQPADAGKPWMRIGAEPLRAAREAAGQALSSGEASSTDGARRGG